MEQKKSMSCSCQTGASTLLMGNLPSTAVVINMQQKNADVEPVLCLVVLNRRTGEKDSECTNITCPSSLAIDSILSLLYSLDS